MQNKFGMSQKNSTQKSTFLLLFPTMSRKVRKSLWKAKTKKFTPNANLEFFIRTRMQLLQLRITICGIFNMCEILFVWTLERCGHKISFS